MSLELVGDAELLALGVELGLDAGEIVAGAVLDFGGGLLVEALDGGEFVDARHRPVPRPREAFRGEQLARRLVDVERVP
jgi:hypothetical protein